MAFPNLIKQVKQIESGDPNTNLSIVAKNSIALPMMMRDINIIKQGIIKLVRSSGGTQRDRSSDFFSTSLKRESDYESRLQSRKSNSPSRIGKGLLNKSGNFISSILGDGLSNLLIKGGLIAGILYAIGKFFSSPEFRQNSIDMVNKFGETIFSEEGWKDVKNNITDGLLILSGGVVAIGLAFAGLKASLVALSAWIWRSTMGTSGPRVPGTTGGPIKGKTSGKFGGRGVLTAGLMLALGLNSENGGVASGAALIGGNILANKATSALDAKTNAKVGAPTKFNANANRFTQGGKFTSTKNLPLGTILEKLKNYLLIVDKRGLKFQLLRRISAKFGIVVALKVGAFITSIVSAPLTAGTSLIISAAMLAWNLSFVYELYEFLMEDADSLENAPENINKSIINEMYEKIRNPERIFTTKENVISASELDNPESGSTNQSFNATPSSSVTSSNTPNRMSSGGYRVSGVFGEDRGTHKHGGVDLAAPAGTPVSSTDNGTVTRSEFSSSYGNVVYVDHGDGKETRYAHLSKLDVRRGDKVSKGQKIGEVGNTGRSTGKSGNHLHYEERLNGVAVSPDMSRAQASLGAAAQMLANNNQNSIGQTIIAQNSALTADKMLFPLTNGVTINAPTTNNNVGKNSGGSKLVSSSGVVDVEFARMLVNSVVGSPVI
jgi:murein DD-endopeptidase MepM/ murein hydrolase activator NlpD